MKCVLTCTYCINSPRFRLRGNPVPTSGDSSPPPPSAETGSGTGLLLTIFLIVNAALGAGLLNFPRAFADAGGVAAGTAVQAVLLVFIMGALIVLAYCADKVN